MFNPDEPIDHANLLPSNTDEWQLWNTKLRERGLLPGDRVSGIEPIDSQSAIVSQSQSGSPIVKAIFSDLIADGGGKIYTPGMCLVSNAWIVRGLVCFLKNYTIKPVYAIRILKCNTNSVIAEVCD